MKSMHCSQHLSRALPQRGFSLIELLIALVIGIVMALAFGNVYLSSQTASRRVENLSNIQQSVRTAFEFLTGDAHAVGMTGCQQSRGSGFTPLGGDLTSNYAVGVEGYDARDTPSFPIATSTSATDWQSNTVGTGTAPTFPISVLGTTAIASGSDVLVLRMANSRPLRLTAAATGTQVTVESASLGGSCADNSARRSGFCAGSYGLIANCTTSQVFRVQSVTAGSSIALTTTSALTTAFPVATAEVFPLQTAIYYVRAGSRAGSQSLYRRVFDGDDGTTNGEEQELIEDVENLQVTYGIDNVDNADSTRNFTVDSYVTANNVTDWSRVLAVRMGLLVRARDPVRGDNITLRPSGSVNGVTITYPTTGDQFDRRVFTTTVALRNRIANR